MFLSERGWAQRKEARFLTKGVLHPTQWNEIHISLLNSFFYFLCAKHKDYWDEEVWSQPSRAHSLLGETNTSRYLPCSVVFPASQAPGALWEDRAGATGREALNMFSVNTWTSLKMCCSGSGGQVDVIIFLLERKKKKKLEVNFSTAIIQSWD